MKRLLALLLFASPLFFLCSLTADAQQTVQIVTVPTHDPVAVYNIPLAPTKAGDMLHLYCMFGTQPKITDTQGNTWLQINTDFTGDWYTPATAGGPETITVTFPQPAYLSCPAITEWPGSYTLKDVIPSRSPTNGGQSINYVDDTTAPSSHPLTVTGTNELVIGFGDSSETSFSCSSVASESGWTMLGCTNERMEQYTIVAAPSTVTSTFTLPLATDGTEGIAGFVPTSAPIANIVTVSISATYDDGSIPTILSVAVADVTSPTTTVTELSLTPNPTTGLASGSFTLSSTETYEVILYMAGTQVGQTFYQGNLVLALMPQISQANFTLVLFKASGAVKSFTSGAS
jgi:hypothetical protein